MNAILAMVSNALSTDIIVADVIVGEFLALHC